MFCEVCLPVTVLVALSHSFFYQVNVWIEPQHPPMSLYQEPCGEVLVSTGIFLQASIFFWIVCNESVEYLHHATNSTGLMRSRASVLVVNSGLRFFFLIMFQVSWTLHVVKECTVLNIKVAATVQKLLMTVDCATCWPTEDPGSTVIHLLTEMFQCPSVGPELMNTIIVFVHEARH